MGFSLILVDSHTIVRKGIVNLFNSSISQYEIADDVSNGNDCIEAIKNNKVDIVLLDLLFADMDCFQLFKQIKKINSKIKVVIFTEDKSNTNLIKAYDMDFDGYILKTISFNELLSTLNTISGGVKYIDPDILPTLNKKLLERDIHEELLGKLTKRETQILINVANGFSNKEIAAECNISERTVKNHLSSIFQKIEVADRTQAAVFAIKTNLIQI